MFTKYTTKKRRISLVLALLLLFPALPVKTNATSFPNRDRIIVSLGDSYSSGEGIEEFFGQDIPLSLKVKYEPWLAHRSQNAWSGMLTLPGVSGTMAENFETNWFFGASSGATTDHIVNSQPKPYKKIKNVAQLLSDTGYVSPQKDVFNKLGIRKSDYVTLTLGGNDADFTGIIQSIVVSSAYLDISGLSKKINASLEEFHKDGGIGEKLRDSYDIISKKAGKQAHIIVAGYPQLLNPAGKTPLITEYEACIVNTAVKNFNKEIKKIVEECSDSGTNISFVSVEDGFQQHGAYSDNPYINGVTLWHSEDLDDLNPLSAYSFHPNLEGARVYAACVQQEIDRLEKERFFNETYWIWNQGSSSESTYAALFHRDGSLHYYKMNEGIVSTTTYQYQNSILKIDGIEYSWTGSQFVSDDAFPGSSSNEYKLQPDKQNSFQQLASSANDDNFVSEMQKQYGTASYTEFTSCIGQWPQKYPAAINGFIKETSIDLDQDGKIEKLALISKNQEIHLQVYSEIEGKYELSYEECITPLDYFSQQNISLFYNHDIGKYVLFVDRNTTGSYTGFDGYYASLYAVTPSSANLIGSINESSYDTKTEDIPKILQTYNVPCAKNCANFSNITLDCRYVELLEIKHRYFDTKPFGGWEGRDHHLQLLTPEYFQKPSDTIQTWTVTMQSQQGFTEYREETYAYQLEAGKKYTIPLVWSDGVETDYTILRYTVDTKERTITIFMDYPQGSEHWKGLILDLAQDTYYGFEYTTFYP